MSPTSDLPASPERGEEDPTGVRELLRGLADPGPMPDDLVARIEARLARERLSSDDLTSISQRAATTEAAPSPDAQAGLLRPAAAPSATQQRADIVDLSSERSRRRPGRTLTMVGAAAAGVMVATAAVGQLFGDSSADSAPAALSPAASTDRSAGAEALSDSTSGSDHQHDSTEMAVAGDGDSDEAADHAPQVQDQASALSWHSGDEVLPPVLAAHLGEIDGDLTTAVNRLDASRSASVQGQRLTAAQSDSCWSGLTDLDLPPERSTAAATSEGQPVVVLVARDVGGDGLAWLLPGTCVDEPDTAPLAQETLRP